MDTKLVKPPLKRNKLSKKKVGRPRREKTFSSNVVYSKEEEFIRKHCELTHSALPTFQRLGDTGYLLTYKQFQTGANESSLYRSRVACMKKLYKFLILCDSFFSREQKAQIRHLKQKHHEPLMEASETIDHASLAFYQAKITCGGFTHTEYHHEEGLAVMRCLNAYFVHLLNKDIEYIRKQLEDEEKAALDAVM
jgi:hypothetical protein